METILIIITVTTAILWAGRSFYKTITGKTGCTCSSGSCSGNNKCTESLEDGDKK